MLEVGTKAPAFELPDQAVVLYFQIIVRKAGLISGGATSVEVA